MNPGTPMLVPRKPPYWTPILYDIAQALESVEDPERRIDRVLALLGRFVPYERCALLEVTPVLSRPVSVAPEGSDGDHDALVGRAAELLALVADHHPGPNPAQAPAPRAAGRVHLAVPMIALGETTGIIYVEHTADPYDDSHLAFLSVVAAQVGAYLAAVRDERKLRASEAKRARLLAQRESDLELLEMFMGMLGHDLRNPLSSIRMCTEHLRLSEGPRLAQTTQRLLASTDRMERMVGQLLDLTRIRLAGGLPIERTRVDLGTLSLRVVDELRGSHPDALMRHEVAGDVSGDWDEHLLLQVVSNLIANALQHSEGSLEITVRVAGAGGQVELTTVNPGIIPRHLLPVLFEPFRGSRDAGRKGLGLGLFITKHIVEAHGGSIEIASAPARGTTVTVRLPR